MKPMDDAYIYRVASIELLHSVYHYNRNTDLNKI
jgi:hypothetical protein